MPGPRASDDGSGHGADNDEPGDSAHHEPRAIFRPAPHDAERQLARAGLLQGVKPVICEGASLSLAGTLLMLPGAFGDRQFR